MPVESICGECGSRVLNPDPRPKTKEENIAFRKDWDERYEQGQAP